MIDYIIKSAICLAVVLVFYHLLLEKEKMHAFNRYFLLAGILFSLTIPAITIHTASPPLAHFNYSQFVNRLPIAESGHYITPANAPANTGKLNWQLVIIVIYTVGVALMLSRFAGNLFRVIRTVSQNKKVRNENVTIVLVDNKIVPHSFWRYIFFSKAEYEHKAIPEELYLHELTHVQQKHSLDILLTEILQVVFWFNPVFIYYKKAVRLNHEFLADEAVVMNFKNVASYQQLLLERILSVQPITLSSNLTYSLTKKRMIMMKKNTSKSRAILKEIALVPLFAALVFLFGTKAAALPALANNIPALAKVDGTHPDSAKDTYYKNATIKYKNKSGAFLVKKYENLTPAEKNDLPYPFFPPPAPNPPGKDLLAKWKSSDRYGIWVDGKQIPNSDLGKYKAADFSFYWMSVLEKGAQHYGTRRFQIDLFSPAYYDAVYKKYGSQPGKMFVILKTAKGKPYAQSVASFSDHDLKAVGAE